MDKNISIDKKSDSNIYLTVTIAPNERTLAFPMQFSSNISYPLIQNLSNYVISVDSASIPSDNLPLWIPIIQPFPNVDNNLTPYTFTLSYNGVTSDIIFMRYVSQNPSKPFIPLSANQIYADYSSTYFYTYTAEFFINMLNNTLTAAFNNLAGKVALPPGAVAPFLAYDPTTDKFSMNAQRDYYDIYNTVLPITVYANYEMFTLINTTEFIFYGVNNIPTSQTDFQFFITNQRNNIFVPSDIYPAPYTNDDYYISMTQALSSISNLSPVKSIVITSSSLPIKSDYIPRKVGTNSSLIGEEIILSEFEPILRFPQENVGNNIIYRPQYRRYKNMLSQLALQRVDISIYWRDFFGTLHIVYCNYNKLASVRLAFQKKR